MGVRDLLSAGFYGLARNINKAGGRDTDNDETAEGIIGEKLPELELNMNDEDLVDLSDTWEKAWNTSDVKSKWIQACDDNEKYWRGEHFDRPAVQKNRSIMDNAIFEGLETYLPQVTRRNPEPMVALAASEMATTNGENDPSVDAKQEYVRSLQATLGELADILRMRLKMKEAARHKEIYLLGVAKFAWDLDRDIPGMKIVRPKRMILDPEATVDSDGYTGERLGEHRKLPAWKMIRLIKGQKNAEAIAKQITDRCDGDMATELGFIEWWTNEYMFWKMDEFILVKRKNPHWNYDDELPEAPAAPAVPPTQAPLEAATSAPPEALPGMPAMPAQAPIAAAAPTPPVPQLPEQGAQQGPKKGVNHFVTPRMPYILLATFTLGKQPVDITSNMGQNLSNQDVVNKRIKQIDKNADSMNQGLVVSMERTGLTANSAKGVTEALRNGGTVVIPTGDPNTAVARMATPGLPADVYNQLVDVRTRIRDIWGIRGSSPAGIQGEETVRGKLIVQGLDTDRIGGGISEYLEQFADDAYNWLTQLLYVYDDRYAAAFASGVPVPKVLVSVKEGSLLPKDSTTIANQAIDLADSGKMSTLDLYKKLDYPNAEELAANVWLEANAPEVLFENDQRVQKVLQQRQAAQAAAAQQAAKPPLESINYKDLPPEGKAEMAEQAGLHIDPASAVAHEVAQNAPAAPKTAPAGP